MTTIQIHQNNRYIERERSIPFDVSGVISYEDFKKDVALQQILESEYKLWDTERIHLESILLRELDVSVFWTETYHLPNIFQKVWKNIITERFSFKEDFYTYHQIPSFYQFHWDSQLVHWYESILQFELNEVWNLFNKGYFVPNDKIWKYFSEATEEEREMIRSEVTMKTTQKRSVAWLYMLYLLLAEKWNFYIISHDFWNQIIVCSEDKLSQYVSPKYRHWRNPIVWIVFLLNNMLKYIIPEVNEKQISALRSLKKVNLKWNTNKKVISDINELVEEHWKWIVTLKIRNKVIEHMKHEYNLPKDTDYQERLSKLWAYWELWMIVENWWIMWYKVKRKYRYWSSEITE